MLWHQKPPKRLRFKDTKDAPYCVLTKTAVSLKCHPAHKFSMPEELSSENWLLSSRTKWNLSKCFELKNFVWSSFLPNRCNCWANAGPHKMCAIHWEREEDIIAPEYISSTSESFSFQTTFFPIVFHLANGLFIKDWCSQRRLHVGVEIFRQPGRNEELSSGSSLVRKRYWAVLLRF